MTDLDEWLSIVAAARRFNTSTQAIRRLVKLGVVPGRRDQAAEAQGIWPILTFVPVGSLDEWFGETARVEHVRRIRATARPLTKEQKIAIARVFVDHLEWARRDRAATQGARKRVEAPGVPQTPLDLGGLEALPPSGAYGQVQAWRLGSLSRVVW